MSASDVFSAHGATKVWPFTDGNVSTISPDVPNLVEGGVDTHAETGSAVFAPCGGEDVVKYRSDMLMRRDFRAPRGAYTSGALPGDDPIETPHYIPRSPIPFPLFSQPFTLAWIGGNFLGKKMMAGMSEYGDTEEDIGSGPIMSYGSYTSCVGFESGQTGGMFNLYKSVGGGWAFACVSGAVPDYYAAYPNYGTAAIVGGASGGENSFVSCRGLNVIVYNPNDSDSLGFCWANGSLSDFAQVADDAALQLTLSRLATYSQPYLMFATGANPFGYGELRTIGVDEYELVYPWRYGYGVIGGVGLWGRALTKTQLRGLFVDISGAYPPGGCLDWYGAGVTVIIDAFPLGDNHYKLDATRSFHAQGGTLVDYQWLPGTNFEGDLADLGVDGPIIDDIEIPYPNVFGNAVTINLRVTDDFGHEGYGSVTINPQPEDALEDLQDWALNRSNI